MIFYAHITYLNLFTTHPCFIFILHQAVGKSLKFTNDGPQTHKSLVNESNFPSFLSLCVFILGHRLGKCPNNLCKYQSILIFPVIW